VKHLISRGEKRGNRKMAIPFSDHFSPSVKPIFSYLLDFMKITSECHELSLL
jgi:hypothetical protein